MSGAVEYRRQAYRSSSAYRDRICIRPGRVEYRMSDERAHMLLQELDSAVHPWGEPGVVPTAPGRFRWQYRDHPDLPWQTEEECELLAGGGLSAVGYDWTARHVQACLNTKCIRFRATVGAVPNG